MVSPGWISASEVKVGNWLNMMRVRRWLRHTTLFVRNCRLIVRTTGGTTLLRLTYLSADVAYAAAESNSEAYLEQLIGDQAFDFEQIIEQQWKRGRLVTHQTLDKEDEDLQKSIHHLWMSGQRQLLICQRIENYAIAS